MMFFNNIINLGTAHQSFSITTKAKMMNIVSIFTIAISAFYTVNYFFILNEPLVATINLAFTLLYFLPLIFSYFSEFKKAKLCFFILLMFHIVACTNVYVTNKSGFHLFLLLVPTGAFLLFELREKVEKIMLSVLAGILFFYCENTVNPSPIIELSDEVNHLIYQSVFFFIMVEVIFVLTLFANQIETNEAELTKQATTDSLTGINNRHYFFQQGNKLLELAINNSRPFSVVLLDFDFFKQINDKYGHSAGDSCLIEISKVMKNYCRPQDILGRIGGEEFAIILTDTTLPEANNITETLRLAIEKQVITIEGQNEFTCTASFGITSRTSQNDNLKELLVEADKALYFAKSQGRNRIKLYENML